MRHVIKGPAPQSLIEWKALSNEDWEPTYENLQNPQKRELHRALLSEQGAVCCYCGRSIGEQDSHIEHFRPQETYPDLVLEYSNLFASCMREVRQPVHCGHAKGAVFHEELQLSPLSAECEGRFLHTLDGRELPADSVDAAAAYTIKVLQQNSPLLIQQRREALAGLFDEAFLSSATSAELGKIIEKYNSRDESNCFRSFAHVIARYADRLRAIETPVEGSPQASTGAKA